MNARILRTLIDKDLRLYFRNRYFAMITVLVLVLYVVIYYALPSTVNEVLKLGVYAPTIPPVFLNFLSNNDIAIDSLESDEALQTAVMNNDCPAGIVLTSDVIGGILRGANTAVTVYVASDADPEIVDAMRTVLRLAFNELSGTLTGHPMQVSFNEQIVGPDMTGQQLAFRDRLVPMLASIVLILEMMGLSTLIVEEAEAGTLSALLITPVTVPGLFTGKAIFGVGFAFVQAALLMLLTGNLGSQPVLILTTLLLGAILVTGLAFLIASISRSMMAVFAWSILLIIVLFIPSYGVVFPGTVSNWVRLIPSYYLFDAIHQVVNFSAPWSAVASNLIILLAMGLAALGAGVLVLQRRTR
ncbi:MAG: ABC transporter permease [Anaerolineae bacterium]